jgi:hypothetical protein
MDSESFSPEQFRVAHSDEADMAEYIRTGGAIVTVGLERFKCLQRI